MCKNSSIPSANAHSAVLTWKAAGFAPSQIVLGVPAYAYISRATVSSLRQKRTGALDASANVRVVNDAGGTETGQVQFRDLIKQGVLARIDRSSSSATEAESLGNPPDPEIEIDGDMACAGVEDYEDDEKQLTLSLSPAGDLMVAVDGSSPAPAPSPSPTPHAFTAALFDGAGGFTRHWDTCSSTPFLRSEFAEQIITFDDPQSLGLKAAWAKEAGILGVNIFDVHGDTDDWDLTDALRKGLGII